MTMLLISAGILVYFIIGGIFSHYLGDESIAIIWPLMALILLVMGVWWVFSWIPKGVMALATYIKNRNKAPSPTEVVQGMIATIALRHIDKWDTNYFIYKNVKITRDRYCESLDQFEVLIEDDKVPMSEKLREALQKSWNLAREAKAERLRYEREHRMLDNLKEFMECGLDEKSYQAAKTQ